MGETNLKREVFFKFHKKTSVSLVKPERMRKTLNFRKLWVFSEENFKLVEYVIFKNASIFYRWSDMSELSLRTATPFFQASEGHITPKYCGRFSKRKWAEMTVHKDRPVTFSGTHKELKDRLRTSFFFSLRHVVLPKFEEQSVPRQILK